MSDFVLGGILLLTTVTYDLYRIEPTEPTTLFHHSPISIVVERSMFRVSSLLQVRLLNSIYNEEHI